MRGHRPADVLRAAHGGILEVELQIGDGFLRAFNKNHDHGSHTAQSSKKSQRKNYVLTGCLLGCSLKFLRKKKFFLFSTSKNPSKHLPQHIKNLYRNTYIYVHYWAQDGGVLAGHSENPTTTSPFLLLSGLFNTTSWNDGPPCSQLT